jgi:hypothetical protein
MVPCVKNPSRAGLCYPGRNAQPLLVAVWVLQTTFFGWWRATLLIPTGGGLEGTQSSLRVHLHRRADPSHV